DDLDFVARCESQLRQVLRIKPGRIVWTAAADRGQLLVHRVGYLAHPPRGEAMSENLAGARPRTASIESFGGHRGEFLRDVGWNHREPGFGVICGLHVLRLTVE